MSGSIAQRLLAGLWILLVAAGAAWPQTTASGLAPGEAFALAFRDHVVKIRVRWASGEEQEGFGFVVGENASGVYIATANHVVRGELPDQTAEQVMLTWFRRSGEEFPAVLLGTNDARRDLAVLRTTLPDGLALQPELMLRPSQRLGRSAPVWYVGRAGEWYVPSQPGTVNNVDLDEQISIDGLNVQVGTSGAPLVTEGGVAGMVIADTIGGVARAIDVGFIERAFAAWNHPWGLAAAVEPAPEAVPEPAAPPVAGRPGETEVAEPAGVALLGTAGQELLAPELQPARVLLGLAAFKPRLPEHGAPTGGALTLREVEATALGAGELEVTARVDFEDLDLGGVTARVSPAAAPGSFDVGLEPDGGGVALQIEGCDVRLEDTGVDLVWDAALASFVSAQVRLGASAVSCPALDVAVRGATLDMAFEPLEGEAWQGWLDLAVEGLVLRACGDLAESCAAGRAAGFGWPWREPTMLEEGRLLVSFDGADLAARMAAFAAETEDSWPRYAAFAAPVFDPLAAAAGVVDPRQVADYLGAVSANLTMRGVTIAGEGAEVGLEAGEADLQPGRPARFTYEVSGVTVRAPGVPPAAPSSAAVQIESAGRLDAATLLRGDFPGAVADAGPFAIEAQVEGALGRVEGTGSVGFDRDGGAALLAAEATLVTDDPVGYLTEVFLAPMAGQVSNLAAFQQAIAEVVALTPQGLPPQPGQERAYEIRYDPLTETVTVDGQDLEALVGALNDACTRYGC